MRALAFDASHDPMMLVDAGGLVVDANAAAAAMLGCDSRHDSIGIDWPELWCPDARPAILASLAHASQGEAAALRTSLRDPRAKPALWDHGFVAGVSSAEGVNLVLVISSAVVDAEAASSDIARSAALYRTVVEATSQIVWHVDLTTGFMDRRGWVEYTGRETDPADIEHWANLVHDEDRDGARSSIEAGLASGRAVNLEYRLKHRSGVWRWVEGRAIPELDSDGNATAWTGIIVDIHDRKTAELQLHHSEERLRLALDAAALGTWDFDLQTGEMQWSPEARRLIGLPPDIAVDQFTILDHVHPEDRAGVEAQRLRSANQGAGTTSTDFRIIRPDTGETRWIAARGRIVLDDRGFPVRRVGTFADFTERKRTSDALRSTLRRYEALLAATSVSVWHSDAAQTRCERQGWREVTGLSPEGREAGWLESIHPDDRVGTQENRLRALAAAEPYSNLYRLRHANGQWRWMTDDVVPLFREDGTLEGWAGTISDVHDRRIAEQALRESEERLRLAIEATGLGTWDVDVTTGERTWSPEFFDLLGLPRSSTPDSQLFLNQIHPDDRDRVIGELDGARSFDGRARVSTFRLRNAANDDRWIEARERTFLAADGRKLRRVGTLQDVSDRKRAEHSVWLAAHTDPLTGLANRTLFQSCLEEAIAEAGAGAGVGLLLIDLDRFKEVNDTAGHGAGDVVLRTVADRLRAHVPSGATVARLGGDEFGVVLPKMSSADAIAALASALAIELRRPSLYDGRELDCSASIGCAAFPDHDPLPPNLLKNADLALYASKAAGRGRAMSYEPAMRAKTEHHLTVLRRARDALVRDAVFPVYQPKVSFATGEIVGFEALLRWTDPNGLGEPALIQQAFADPELSAALGARMLNGVVGDMRAWTASDTPFGTVALNVAAPQFQGGGLAEAILQALSTAEIAPSRLEIEVTESAFLDGDRTVVESNLAALCEAGIAIAMDEFGTGYASLVHLHRFPVSWLKIDRSFISTLESHFDFGAVAAAVIGLAHSMGIKVVAGGIETSTQMDRLIRAGCDLGQGYLIAKPMRGSRVAHFLANWRGLPQAHRQQIGLSVSA